MAAGLTWYFWPSGQKENNTPEDTDAYREFVLKMWDDKNKWARNILTTNHGQKKTQYYISCDKAFECLKNAFLSLSKNGSFDPSLLQKACAEANILPEEHDVYCLESIYTNEEQTIRQNIASVQEKIVKIIDDSRPGDDIDMVKKAIKDTLEESTFLTKANIDRMLKKYCAQLEKQRKKAPTNLDIMSYMGIRYWKSQMTAMFAFFSVKKILNFQNIPGELGKINPTADPRYKEAYTCMLEVFNLLNHLEVVSDEKIEELAKKFKEIGIGIDDVTLEACLRIYNFATINQEDLERRKATCLVELKREVLFSDNMQEVSDEESFVKRLKPLYTPDEIRDAIAELDKVRQERQQAFEQATPENYTAVVKHVFEELSQSEKRIKSNRRLLSKICTVTTTSIIPFGYQKYKNATTQLINALKLLQAGKSINGDIAEQLANAFKEINILPPDITKHTFYQLYNICCTYTPAKELLQKQQNEIDKIENNMKELDDETLNSVTEFEAWAISKLKEAHYIPFENIPQGIKILEEFRNQILAERTALQEIIENMKKLSPETLNNEKAFEDWAFTEAADFYAFAPDDDTPAKKIQKNFNPYMPRLLEERTRILEKQKAQ